MKERKILKIFGYFYIIINFPLAMVTTFMETTLSYCIHVEISYSEIFGNSYIRPSLKYFASANYDVAELFIL